MSPWEACFYAGSPMTDLSQTDCHKLHAGAAPTPRATTWYRKSLPTFSDAIAAIRRDLWSHGNFEMSISLPDLMEIPETTINTLIATACYAA